MRHFIKLCETIKTYGISISALQIDGGQDRVKVIPDSGTIEWLNNSQPIVFVSDHIEIDMEIPTENSWGHAEGKIDAPFKYFSIEKMNGPLLYSPDCDISDAFYVWCVCVNEVAPNEYRFLTLVEREKSGTFSVAATNSEIDVCNKFLELFNRQEVGIMPAKGIVKIGSGENKTIRKIKRVIYVSPKKEMRKISESHKSIDWSHRWLVRGHWRKIQTNKLGKDRAGNYCVKGFTWVTEFEKGPDSAPLITKTRVVERGEL